MTRTKDYNWTIYGNYGYWFAWNRATGKQIDFGYCSFAEAVGQFEIIIGTWYADAAKIRRATSSKHFNRKDTT